MDDRWLDIFSEVTHQGIAASGADYYAYPPYREARELRDHTLEVIQSRLGPEGKQLVEAYEKLDGICNAVEMDAAFWAGVRTAALFFTLVNNPAPLIGYRGDADELEECRSILKEIEAGARAGRRQSTA